jgi:oligopeptide/dipeptide ABC transporter ATP-binding protein
MNMHAEANSGSPTPVLQIRNLTTVVSTHGGPAAAVDDISFDLMEGETLGLVGESGSGKSLTGLSIMRLLPRGARLTGGQALLWGSDILSMTSSQLSSVRGRVISMVLQDPMTALDPVLTVGAQITEALRAEDRLSSRASHERALRLLREFGISDPTKKIRGYPHQMSGGMRQRIVGAIAISRSPAVLIADEPTTSLDATLQLDYIRLLKEIQRESKLAIIFITHDFGVVERMCDRVAVMYSGKIVETGTAREVLSTPRHPYTKGLVGSIPDSRQDVEYLPTIGGEPPSLEHRPAGCSFAARCKFAISRCVEAAPPAFPLGPGRAARCWRLDEIG